MLLDVRLALIALWGLLAWGCAAGRLDAAGGGPGPVLRWDRSRRVELRSDLDAVAARGLLERVERSLRWAAGYWGRPLPRPVLVYVARDIRRWPDQALPHPLARVIIGGIGGATLAESGGARGPRRALVLAKAERGVAEHEVVHAYCLQAFGRLGPPWYKEGMAEWAYYASVAEADRAPLAELGEFFRSQPFKPLDEVLRDDAGAERLARTMRRLQARYGERPAPWSAWTEADAAAVREARRQYRWAWALCRVMAENPNYADRFRLLGARYLEGRPGGFEQLFAADRSRLEFEYRFFVEHFEPGFRPDLCRWPWDARYERLGLEAEARAEVRADRGYQASGVWVTAGRSYAVSCDGRWRTGAATSPVTADGDHRGVGRLEGVVLAQGRLSEPMELGAAARFLAPADGPLLLRCRDAWSSLADNAGAITVRLRRLGPAGS